MGQVLRRTTRAALLARGQIRQEVCSALASLPPRQATAAHLESRWRGHWTIENRVHDGRDVTIGEDAEQRRAGGAPRALAALHNAARALFRRHGWPTIADAIRHYGAYTHRALRLLGAPAPGL